MEIDVLDICKLDHSYRSLRSTVSLILLSGDCTMAKLKIPRCEKSIRKKCSTWLNVIDLYLHSSITAKVVTAGYLS